jgi:hypothetical protein
MIEHDGLGTDSLIRNLSAQAGSRAGSSLALGYALGLGVALSLAAALVVVVAVPGLRPGLLGVIAQGAFLFKLAATGLLVLGGICLVLAAGIPGRGMRPLRVLAPAAVLMLAGVVVDDSGRSLLGARTLSVPICVGAIILASLPGVAFLLLALRRGIPTRLASAGAAAGLLSGAIGAMAYTLACVNDGATFVTVWYVAAIVITTGIGAVVGRRALAW